MNRLRNCFGASVLRTSHLRSGFPLIELYISSAITVIIAALFVSALYDNYWYGLLVIGIAAGMVLFLFAIACIANAIDERKRRKLAESICQYVQYATKDGHDEEMSTLLQQIDQHYERISMAHLQEAFVADLKAVLDVHREQVILCVLRHVKFDKSLLVLITEHSLMPSQDSAFVSWYGSCYDSSKKKWEPVIKLLKDPERSDHGVLTQALLESYYNVPEEDLQSVRHVVRQHVDRLREYQKETWERLERQWNLVESQKQADDQTASDVN